MAQSSQLNLDIEGEGTEENSNRNNAIHRMDPAARPLAPNRSNIGLGDRLNSVFREIRPLVEHARMVFSYYYPTVTQCNDKST